MSASLSWDATMGVGVDGMRIAMGAGVGCMGATVGGGAGGMGAAGGAGGMGVAVGVGCMGVEVGGGATVAIGLIATSEGSGSVPQAASVVSAATAMVNAATVRFARQIPIRMDTLSSLSRRIVTHLMSLA